MRLDKKTIEGLMDTLADNKQEGLALKEWLEARNEDHKKHLSEEANIDQIRVLQGAVQAYEKLLKRLNPKKERNKKSTNEYL